MNNAWKRLLSAALAVILAVGLTRPAVAANDGAETTDTTTQSAPVTSGDNEAAPAADLVNPRTVQIKVYRNGDTSQVYYTTTFKVEKGAEVTPLIEDYYSSRYGFEVDGWFNDGGWNNYVAGKNATELETVTVNSWTNLYCMVTDYNNVVVYGVTNGDKDNAETLYEGKTLYGTNLVEYLNANAGVAERPGYTLDKWYNWDWFGGKFGDDKLVTGWTNVYVTYTANKYTLSFNANGGTVDPASKEVTYDEAVGTLPTPTKTGSTFAYWQDSAGNKYTEDTVYQVAGNTELTAVWNAVDYTLTLDFGGKGEFVNEDRTVHYGTAIGELPVGADTLFSVRENGVFHKYFISGWVDGDGNPVTAETLYNVEGNSTIYAQYQMAPDSSCTTDELLTIQCSTDESHRWVVNWFGTYVNLDKKSIAYDTENQRWTAQVKFTGMFLVNTGNIQDQHFGGYTHYYDNDPVVINLYWDAQTNLWQVAEPVVKTVYCHDAPAAPTDATIQKLQKLIWIRDTNKLKNNYRPTGLKAGTYSVGKMYTENGKFYVDLTITNLDAYIDEFEAKFPSDFGGYVTNEDETTAEFTYTLVYTGDVYDYAQDGTGWTVDQAKSNMTATDFTNGKQLWVIDRYVVTYTDGTANESVFADEVHNIPLANKGTATPAFAGDYTRPGYTFAGWSPKIASTVTESVTYEAQWTPNTYTLTLDPNGGTLNGSTGVYTKYVEYGERISLSSIKPVRTGYTFQGWANAAEEIVIPNNGVSLYWKFTEHQNLHAVWTAKTYTVKFDANGGTVSPTSKKATYDAALGELPVPTRTGYTFLGWFDKNGEEVTSETIFRNTATTTYTAKWEAKTYTVTFNPDGGTVDPTEKEVTFDAALGELPTPTKTGYTFQGWKDSTGTLVTADTVYQVEGDSTLTAVWEAKEYTLTLDFGGKGEFENKTITVTFGQPIGELDMGVDTLFQVRENGVFRNYFIGGWAFKDGTAVTGETVYAVDGNSTIYAQYIMAPDNSCTTDELFTIQCSTCEDHVWVVNWFGTHVTLDKTSIAYDEANQRWTAQVNFRNFSLVNLGNINEDHFGGFKHYYDDDSALVIDLYWDTESSLWQPVNAVVGEVYCYDKPAAPSTETVESLQKLIWVRDTNSTRNWYKPTGLVEGTYTVGDMYEENGKFYVDLTITDLTPYIQAFMDKIDGSGYVVDQDKTTAEFEFTLVYKMKSSGLKDYAQDGTGWVVDQTKSDMTNTDMGNGKQLWVINRYVITYTDGVSNAVIFPDQVYDIPLDGTHNTPAFVGTPSRVGYTFEGWSPDITHPVTQSVTYTAQWQAKTYTVYLNANGGEVSKDRMDVAYDSKLTGLPTPTRTGYTFAGWYDGDGKRYYATTTYKVDGDLTLTAKWTAKTYTVKFDANGGTVSPTSKKATYDAALGELPVPTRTGYTFLGWFDANDQEVTSETIFRNTATTTYTAKWEANTYTVTFNPDGGTVDPTSKEVTFDAAVGELPVSTKTGYTFQGWVDAEGNAVTADTVYTVADNTTYTAQWTANTYVINLDAGEGIVDPTTVQVTFGQAVGTLPTPTREHYDFLGWYDENGEEVTSDTVYSVAANITLTAKWEVGMHNKPTKKVTDSDVQKMQISFYAMGTEVINPNGEPFSVGGTSGKIGTNTTYEIGEVYGNDVEGYFVDITFHFASGEKLESNGRAAFNRHNVISDYPEWVGNWKYNFEAHPEYGADQTLTLEYNMNMRKWVVPGGNNMTSAVATVIHVYMDLEQYTVTYTDGVEDEEIFADTTILVGEGNTTPAFSGTTDRTGYTFQGWSPEVAETVTGNVTYTAQWTANTYTITLVNGEESTTMEVTYGQPIGELPNLENAHSDFEGWFDENGNQVTGDMVYTRTDNMTLTAKWTGHVMTKVEAVTPTCTEDGNTAYWYCADCGKYYSDESCTVEIALEDTVVPATGHHAVKTEAKAATCTEDGNIAYWYCPDCGKYFADEACTQEITLESTVIKALGHDYQDGKCTVCGEKDPDYVQPTDPEGPDQTGENTNVALLVSLLVLSAACLAVVITKSRQWKVR